MIETGAEHPAISRKQHSVSTAPTLRSGRYQPFIPFLAIRAGATVVIASLLDWGAMAEAVSHPLFEAAEQLELHPSQFAEIAAFGAYTAGPFNREFGHKIEPQGDHDVLHPVMIFEEGASPDDPVFLPIQYPDFGRVLADFTGQKLEDIFDPEGERLWTNLRNEDGSPSTLLLEDAPVGVEVRPPHWRR